MSLLTMDVIGRADIVIQSLMSVVTLVHGADATRHSPLYICTPLDHPVAGSTEDNTPFRRARWISTDLLSLIQY